MREIKFRAWNKIIRCMCKPFKIEELGKYSKHYTTLSGFVDEVLDFNDCDLMQFTGLKDKNKKDIYEGDILFSKEKDMKVNMKGNIVVIFENCEFCAKKISKDIREDFESLGNYRYKDCYECEVIGNIYENPELLEKSK